MLLFDDRNTATTAGDNDLICICKCADRINLHDLERLWCSDDTLEALARYLFYIIALFDLHIRIFTAHVTADRFLRCVECFIVRIYGYLRQDRADRLCDTTAHQLCLQGILNIVSDIALAHCGADTHRSRCVVDINTSQLCHSLVDHADLRTVGMGDGKLVICFNQIS